MISGIEGFNKVIEEMAGEISKAINIIGHLLPPEYSPLFESNGLEFYFWRSYNEHGHRVNTVCKVRAKEGFLPNLFLSRRELALTAYLHPKDRFNKHIGKRVSLSKILNWIYPGKTNRNTRKEIFAEFEKVCPGKRR